jgi:hypothetical protein
MFASKKHLICVYSNAQKDRKVQSHENSDKSGSFFWGGSINLLRKKNFNHQPVGLRVLGPTVVEAHWHDGAGASVPDGLMGDWVCFNGLTSYGKSKTVPKQTKLVGG